MTVGRSLTQNTVNMTDIKMAEDFSTPLVSIITPVFNGQQTIAGVVNSIRNQTYKNIQHVIVDDGSTDNTFLILEELQRQYTGELILIRQENQGEANAVNKGFEMTCGDFISIVNADDPLMENCLESLVRALQHNSEAIVAYGDWLMCDRNSHVLKTVKTLDYSQQTLVGDFVCIVGPGSLIRRSAIQRAALRNSDYPHLSDYEMWLTLSMMGDFVRVPEILSIWTNDQENATNRGRGVVIAQQYLALLADFFARDEITPEIRLMKRRATAHAYYYAALNKFFDSSVPGRRLMLKSWILCPLVGYAQPSNKRSFLGSIALMTLPISLTCGSWLARLGVELPMQILQAIEGKKVEKIQKKSARWLRK